MRIGIDIDDTITNSWEYYIPLYSKIFDIPIDEFVLTKPYYDAVKHKFTRDEFNERLSKINDTYSLDIPIKADVKDVIDKLYDLGHSVVFITARNKDFYDADKSSKQYIDKHHIRYEKIYTSAYEKDRICLEENIDLFIDDSVRNCKSVASKGIEVIMFDAPHNRHMQEFNRLKNWKEIYEYIKSR